MKIKGIALIAAFAVVFTLSLIQGAGVGAAEPLISFHVYTTPPLTLQTPMPLGTANPATTVVNIPDTKLKTALHTATGIAANKPIHQADLAALSGTLDLAGKGIANAEGLQYCTNLGVLKMNENSLSSLPASLKKLTKLTEIWLEKNKFSNFPAVLLQMPKLQMIRLSTNSITKIPDNIDAITSLDTLLMDQNKLTAIPAALGNLHNLYLLNLDQNQIKAIPKEVFKAPNLTNLALNANQISELPDLGGITPQLYSLGLMSNNLSKLPAWIGTAPNLEYLDLSRNRFTSLDPMLLSGKIKNLRFSLNYLKSLPEKLKGMSFDFFLVDWNFLNVSAGSSDREILDSLHVTGYFAYENQLAPVSIVSKTPAQDSIALAWKPLHTISGNGWTWDVEKIELFDGTASPDKLLAKLGPSAKDYTATGLLPGVEYDLYVRITYDSGGTKRSCDTHAKATTLSAATATPSAEATATAETTAAVSASAVSTVTTVTPTATPPEAAATAAPATAPESAAASGGDSVLLIAILAVGVLILAALAILIVLQLKRKKQS